jgi:hypothetical protein
MAGFVKVVDILQFYRYEQQFSLVTSNHELRSVSIDQHLQGGIRVVTTETETDVKRLLKEKYTQ